MQLLDGIFRGSLDVKMMMVSINDSLDASKVNSIKWARRGVREKIRGHSTNEWKTLIIGRFVVGM